MGAWSSGLCSVGEGWPCLPRGFRSHFVVWGFLWLFFPPKKVSVKPFPGVSCFPAGPAALFIYGRAAEATSFPPGPDFHGVILIYEEQVPLAGFPQLSSEHHEPPARGDIPGGRERPGLPPAGFVSWRWILIWSGCPCEGQICAGPWHTPGEAAESGAGGPQPPSQLSKDSSPGVTFASQVFPSLPNVLRSDLGKPLGTGRALLRLFPLSWQGMLDENSVF